jgi:tetratricopeptide (TPR) repeat protein
MGTMPRPAQNGVILLDLRHNQPTETTTLSRTKLGLDAVGGKNSDGGAQHPEPDTLIDNAQWLPKRKSRGPNPGKRRRATAGPWTNSPAGCYADRLVVPLARAVLVTLAVSIAASRAGALPVAPVPSVPPGQQEAIPPALEPAVTALRKGDIDTALTIARAFVKSQPGSALGQEVLGDAARRRQLWSEAEQALTEAVRLEPTRATALIRLGDIALERADPKKAEARFRQTIAAAPQFGLAHHGLAVALARQGKLAAAIKAAEDGVRLSTEQEVEPRLNLAKLYYEAGRLPDAERLLSQILAHQPDLQPALLLQGIVKVDRGETDEGSALFEQVAARDPASVWARFGLAIVQRVRGQIPAARAELEKIAKEHPDWSLAHMELGLTLLLEKQPDAALKAFDRGERASGDPRQARLRTARSLILAGYPELAITRTKSLLGSPDVAAPARDLLVRAYLARKAPEQAERVLRDAVAGAPRDPVALLQLGDFYLERGRARDALVQFDRATAVRPDAAQPLVSKAQAHVALGEPDAAIAAAERVVKLRGQSPDAYLFLATTQQRVGRSADAVKTYRQALAKDPKHLGALRGLAAQYERDGQRAEAFKMLEEAAKVHPESAVPLLDLGTMLERHERVVDAISAYREGLRRAPDDPVLLNNLAYLLAKTPASLPEAATLSERAHKKAPRNAAIADTYGWIVYQQGSVEQALPILQDAARLAPANAEIQYHLGAVYARLGKRMEARRALEQALRDSALVGAADARKLLDSLR